MMKMKPKIKICGITNREDLQEAISLGFDYAGFIFFPFSPRNLNLGEAFNLISKVNFNQTAKVGIFVDSNLEYIKKAVNEFKLDVVQVHGEINSSFTKNLLAMNVEVWKVFSVKNENSILQVKGYKNKHFLIDKYDKHLRGGTGKSIDSSLVNSWLKLNKKIILSGGLNLAKIRTFYKKLEEGIFAKTPYVFDFNSKLETRPGRKDHKKMKQLIDFFKKKRFS